MVRPRLFLSAVSAELRTARQSLARTVRTLGYDPVSQDDFPPDMASCASGCASRSMDARD